MQVFHTNPLTCADVQVTANQTVRHSLALALNPKGLQQVLHIVTGPSKDEFKGSSK
jgi:hypothetical protein